MCWSLEVGACSDRSKTRLLIASLEVSPGLPISRLTERRWSDCASTSWFRFLRGANGFSKMNPFPIEQIEAKRRMESFMMISLPNLVL